MNKKEINKYVEKKIKDELEKIENVELELMSAFYFRDSINGSDYWVQVIKNLNEEINLRKILLRKLD